MIMVWLADENTNSQSVKTIRSGRSGSWIGPADVGA
jgi:hypothetical protein